MKKREFLKTTGIIAVGAVSTGLVSCTSGGSNTKSGEDLMSGSFTLPDLPYSTEALEPYIDARTMSIHHGKHHAGYVRKLNAALADHSLKGKSLDMIVQSVGDEDTAVRNNGGGHFNHSLFWKIMKPGGGNTPSGKLDDAINSTFASFDDFKEQFSKAAATRFGSGWAWLSVDGSGKLFVSSTPNQDNPMMSKLVERSGTPILGIDVWEHAYYLKYQNRRTEYIDNFFNIINWEQVAANYDLFG